ncbi:MAG: biotin--[acetyl-CoA-carboxylase] ligase [Chloroflexi bacterium]|nr:biotin--[acetyl-CoA-carboxylase] ligase [Chloroflexota bacterium]|tara:strand:- start:5349 stop:6098 length:750 start_codon:yes stop_codon:yes gene_type:complete
MKKNMIANKIYIFDKLSSTMDKSKDLINNGACHGTVVVARYQTNGRGSNNRDWISEGNDALFSLILDIDKSKLQLLSIVSAYSVLSMLEDILRNEVISIKWPNDVLVNGKKISGNLIENVIQGSLVKSIVGVGININSNHKSTNRFIYPSVSLMEIIGKELDILTVIEKYLSKFSFFYSKLINNKINIENISKHLYGLEKKVSFRTNYLNKKNNSNNLYKIIKLNKDGTLKVEDNNGYQLNLSASEISN